MDWNAIAAIGEIAGATAVVISLIYLALQIRTSNRIALRDAQLELMGFNGEVWKHTFESPGLAVVRAKLRHVDFELSPEEYELATDWAGLLHQNISAVDICIRTGFMDSKVVDAYFSGFQHIIGQYPGIRPFLREGWEGLGLKPSHSEWWGKILPLSEEQHGIGANET